MQNEEKKALIDYLYPNYNLHELIIIISKYSLVPITDFLNSYSLIFPKNTKIFDSLKNEFRSTDSFSIFSYKIEIFSQKKELLTSHIISKRFIDFINFINILKKSKNNTEIIKLSNQTKINQQDIYSTILNFLNSLCLNDSVRKKLVFFYSFLEISYYQINNSLIKFKEGFLKQKINDDNSCSFICDSSKNWSLRWFILTSEAFIFFKDNIEDKLIDMFIIDNSFMLDLKQKKGILMHNSFRSLFLNFDSLFETALWSISINESLNKSPYRANNRFLSTFPVHPPINNCKFYIDGEDYFKAIYHEINKANSEILIMGWFLSPELLLLRPGYNFEIDYEKRLDQTLLRAAKRGVKIYLIIYHEPPFFYHKSERVIKYFQLLHPNFKTVRHPGGELFNVSIWSHHQKYCIIDRKIGFLGGLDLSFGRCDNQNHKLFDEEYLNNSSVNYWQGKDYNNSRIKQFENVDKYKESIISKDNTPRLPWHDISFSAEGPVVRDFVKNFIDYWNFFNFVKIKSNEELKLAITLADWIIDYNDKNQNNYLKNINQSNFTSESKNLIKLSNDISRSDSKNIPQYSKKLHKKNENQCKIKHPKLNNSIFETQSLKLTFEKQNFQKDLGKCSCQVIRSAGLWSLGLNQVENSIHLAYIELILNAKSFILIQNQYFISSLANGPVKNLIAEALVLRIKNAALTKTPFKVMIYLPLIVDNAGAINQNDLLQRIQMWNYKTISNGISSLYGKLKADINIKDPSKYISFYGLRTHAKINNIPYTEEIYVHAKIMIIDDEIAVIGSANINDRSLLGSRDSEICVIIEDNEKVDGVFSGKNRKSSKFAKDFRMNLFKEHFDLDENTMNDPLDEDFLNIVKENCKKNTEIYREIFRCYPDDNVKALKDLDNFMKLKKLEDYDKLIKGIKGQIVEYPLEFMKFDENKKDNFSDLYPDLALV